MEKKNQLSVMSPPRNSHASSQSFHICDSYRFYISYHKRQALEENVANAGVLKEGGARFVLSLMFLGHR